MATLEQIRADFKKAESSTAAMTFKQGGYLWRFTGCKFWEPEQIPPPNKWQMSVMIDTAISWNTSRGTEKDDLAGLLEEFIQTWFPDWDRSKLYFRMKGHKKTDKKTEDKSDVPDAETKGDNSEEQQEPKDQNDQPEPVVEEKQPEPVVEPEPIPEPKPEPKKKAKKKVTLDPSVIEMVKMVKAGIRNIWMVGAAGSGKTTMGGIVADELDVPCTIISCGLGTSSVEFLGYKYPSRESTPFAGAFGQASIIILDEFTALDPAVAQVCNSALANGQITTTTGVVKRHPDCVIIATSNTFGDGADRQYVANQQLDAATIDRFMGGIIEVGYSKQYESRFDIEVRTYVLALRKLINQHSFRRVASTRMMIQGEALKNGQFVNWRNRLIINWSSEEKSVVANNLGVAMVETQKEESLGGF